MAPEVTERGGTQLFTVRLWVEDLGEGGSEYRGLVRHVLSGASWHFRNWEDLRRWMVSALERYEATVNRRVAARVVGGPASTSPGFPQEKGRGGDGRMSPLDGIVVVSVSKLFRGRGGGR